MKKNARYWFRTITGLDVRRSRSGQVADDDLGSLVSANSPIIFDVGANVGQTIELCHQLFRDPIIHSFEPNEAAFKTLRANYGERRNVHLNPVGLGSSPDIKAFNENKFSDLSSFLPLDRDGWGEVTATRDVKLSTVDHYCAERNIKRIDLLKSDTQGFELEVLKGADGMLRGRGIKFIFFEIIFSQQYKGLPSTDDFYQFLSDHNFEMIGLYPAATDSGVVGWADALFRLRQS
jgi:FkbM family methyltransferase